MEIKSIFSLLKVKLTFNYGYLNIIETKIRQFEIIDKFFTTKDVSVVLPKISAFS